jgi:hypothetical protein
MPEGMKEIILPTGNGGDLGITALHTHTHTHTHIHISIYICLSLVEKPFQI